MFSYCADPSSIEGLAWLSCYITTPKHMSFYVSFGVVLLLIALAAPIAMGFGFAGALASRSPRLGLRFRQRLSGDDPRRAEIVFLLSRLRWIRLLNTCGTTFSAPR